MRIYIGIFICLVVCCSLSWSAEANPAGQNYLDFEELPDLPPPPGNQQQMGLAGVFAGVNNDVLIIAGGVNFPSGPGWEQGKKIWRDNIYLLQKTNGTHYQWVSSNDFRIPHPRANGVSVSTDEGVICIGGSDGRQCFRDVFLLRWDPRGREIAVESLPDLPCPLAFMGGAQVGQTLYVVGGQESLEAQATKHFFALNLKQKDDPAFFEWEHLPGWPGPARVLPVVAGQNNGITDCLYVFSGCYVGSDTKIELLTDSYEYNPQNKTWKQLAEVSLPGESPRCVMSAPGIASGAHHILIFGGDEGELFLELEQKIPRVIKKAELTGQAKEVASLLEKKTQLLIRNPGFSRDILAYHTITNTWVKVGTLPGEGQLTTTAVQWGNRFIIPTGAISPDVLTPKILSVRSAPMNPFGTLNYLVLSMYFIILVGVGFYFSRKMHTTDDFFKAGGRIPWWAAGISIFGTQLSAVTFMAIPAKTYATDWSYFTLNMTIVMVAPFVIFIYLPFYRRLNITTAYEYLEKRFNLVARLIGSAMFIALQLGRIGIVLFLPSIALSVVTGIDVELCIIIMGVLSIAYTVMGGIEAVIWTDVIQVIVLLGGALLCLVLIIFNIEGGINGLAEMAQNHHKLHTFDFHFDFTTPTFWVILLGGLGANLITYGTDQTVIQRYLTTKDEKDAARGIWTNAILCIPATFLCFGIGTALFVFYKMYPGRLNPTLDNPDAIFPWYIVTQLPQPAGGLLIAATFAAAMSSLDSSMNSIATALTTDFYRRFRAKAPEQEYLKLARWITVIVGAAGISFALVIVNWPIKSLWDQLQIFIGLFAGGLGGLFLLGIFSCRAHGRGAVLGLIAGGIVQYVVKEYTPISFLLYTFTGIVTCMIVGYVTSIILPAKGQTKKALTIYALYAQDKFD